MFQPEEHQVVHIRQLNFDSRVHDIKEQVFYHQDATTKLIAHLTKVESDVRTGRGSAEKLLTDLRVIRDGANQIINGAETINNHILGIHFVDKVKSIVYDIVRLSKYSSRLK